MCGLHVIQYWYIQCNQFPSGPRHHIKNIFESPAKPPFNKSYMRDTIESWARCSPVTPYMKPGSLRPPWLFQSLVCIWLSPEITLGFHKSHPCVDESHSVFCSRGWAWSCYAYANPSLFTTPWQPLSDLVTVSFVRLQWKLQLTPGSHAVTANFYMWKIRQMAHSTVD